MYNDEKPVEENLSSDISFESKNRKDDEGHEHLQVEGNLFNEPPLKNVKTKRRILRFFLNKYVITIILFLVWIFFFDSNNLLSRFRINSELRKMKEQKEYYREEIKTNEITRDQLMYDLDEVETFGREKYLMKRDNEDIFLIIKE